LRGSGDYSFLLGEVVDISPTPSPAFRRMLVTIHILKDYGYKRPTRTGLIKVQAWHSPCAGDPKLGFLGKFAIDGKGGEIPKLITTPWNL
jgi:hypothetical protein